MTHCPVRTRHHHGAPEPLALARRSGEEEGDLQLPEIVTPGQVRHGNYI